MSSPTLTAWALWPSVPPTSASDGGLFATETVVRRSPTATANEQCDIFMGGNPKLIGSIRSLTPVKNDAKQSGSAARGPSLTSQARAARSPTPAANDAARGGESRETKAARGSGGINLRQAINYSPTPTGNKGGSTSRSGDRKGELLLGGAIRQLARGDEPTTNGSTPGRRYSSTAAAQDSGNVTLPPSQATRDTLPGDLIRLNQEAGPSPSSPDSSSANGNARGSISAEWETQYMGYPDGWLLMSTGAESWRSGTRSALKSYARSQRALSRASKVNDTTTSPPIESERTR